MDLRDARPTAARASTNALGPGEEAAVSLTDRARRLLETPYAAQKRWARIAKRLLWPVLRSANGRLVEATRELADAVDAVAAGQRSDRMRNDLERRAAVEDLRSTIAELDGQTSRLRSEVVHLREERDALTVRLRAIQRRLAEAGGMPPAASPDHPMGAARPAVPVLDFAAYLEFERTFRGSREVIVDRQRHTLDLVHDVLEPLTAPLVDLGCGRGEWLEVLSAAGVPSYGVDSNPDMAGAGQERGLDIRVDDGMRHLAEVPTGSLGAVSAFHLVEHLPLPVLAEMLDAAYDALTDGGALLIETPDPTNLVVGAAQFYLDPTHLRPLHPLLLKFLVESRGFVDVRIERFHPLAPELVVHPEHDVDEEPAGGRTLAVLSEMVFGPQDYLVVARRPARIGASDESPDNTSNATSE